jgi:hypothetical protein
MLPAGEWGGAGTGIKMKGRLAWVMIGFLIVMVGGVVLLYFSRPELDAINPANCAKIKKGMVMDQVEAILGRQTSCLKSPISSPFPAYVWEGKRGFIIVTFDSKEFEFESNGATAAAYYPYETSFIDRLQNWLGW